MDAPVEKVETDLHESEVYIFDRRNSEAPEVKLKISNAATYEVFREEIKKALKIKTNDFVISTTSREEISGDESWGNVEKGDTFYILNDINQELCGPAQERVNYLPHYDTIVKGGMYEYYASEGQNPLPYAFAELIDNALAATALNDGPRKIELRLYVDEGSVNKSCVVVLDNGKGMTPRQLNNWAIYRLSKFTRRQRRNFETKGDAEPTSSQSPPKNPNASISLADTYAPRFMNSDISYFGVGGKQAVFFIGNATRMITKPKDSKDVHELSISKEEFERKERNHQAIYTGYIRNRQPGDASHLSADEEHVARLVSEEGERTSFTAVVIQGINAQHLTFLKYHFHMWTRQLAHIYHFYLHGPNGNLHSSQAGHDLAKEAFNNIDIQVNMYIRGGSIKSVNLHNIEDDMQTQYARTAASTFDFKAYVDGSTEVEGIIRYHPFKYDRETYPVDVYGLRVDPVPEDDHGYAINDRPARGRRPVFETYWNGRLIPYTLIEEFEWCSLPKRQKNIPTECYNRISGVIWTSDSFQVSTNKLTFLDLEMKLRDKNTNFVRILQGHEKRTNIDKEFQNWLRECNEEHDKQILFKGNKGIVSRLDQPKLKQTPWTKFSSVEWDNKTYKAGQMVRILRTTPVLCGTLQAFYLYGEHEGDVCATGGDIELLQEPQSLYSDRKFVSLNKLDRSASALHIAKYIEEEEAKLPDHLLISWPNGMEVSPNEKRLTGKVIGDLKVEICNKKGEKISKIPFSTAGSKKLMMELKVIWHSPSGDQTIVSLLSQHGKTWPYWFRKMDCTKNIGAYTIQLNTVLNESGNTRFAGKELPSHKIKFTVAEGEAVKFTLGVLDGPFKVGVPFNIPLEFQDRFNNSTRPPPKVTPILDADGLELSYENTNVKGHSCFIKGVLALGAVPSSAGKTFSLKVSLPDLDQSQTLKIRLLPGPAAKLSVHPTEPLVVMNGRCPVYKVEVQDAACNLTSGGKQTVLARLTGASGLPSFSVDCSATGTALLSDKPIYLKQMTGEKKITAIFDIQGVRNMKSVERTIFVTPSSDPSTIKVFYQEEGEEKEITAGQTITREAGSTIQDLSFALYNEAGQTIEMDEQVTSTIRVNWAPKVGQDLAEQSLLPPIKVLQSVLEPKYCQVSVLGANGLELQFSVLATSGPATQMTCQFSGTPVCTVGETHPSQLVISFTDKFGNKALMPSGETVKVTGPSLDPLSSTITSDRSHLLFTEVGQQEIQVTVGHLASSVKCTVLAGPPAEIRVEGWERDEPLIVHSDRPVSKPLKVSLYDSAGNHCLVKNVAISLSRDKVLKVKPTSIIVTGSNGVADFGILTFTGPLGSYELTPKAQLGKTSLEGPPLSIHIQADLHKPDVIEASVVSNGAPVIAGQTALDFSVTIKSEGGGLLSSASLDCLSMEFSTVQAQSVQKTGPGSYTFKKCQVPDKGGCYSVTFVYDDGMFKIRSKPLLLSVDPGHPATLSVCGGQLTTPTVSNTRSSTSRTLIKSLELELKDAFGNVLSKDYDGKVTVEITSTATVEELPKFSDGTLMLQFPLINGRCKLQNLMVQENTSGKDGFEYHLQCCVVCDAIPKNKPLAPLNIPFLFYNDARKQHQMSALSKERDALRGAVIAYRSMFHTQDQLTLELRAGLVEAKKEEQSVRVELRRQNIPGNSLGSIDAVNELIKARTKEREQVLHASRRSCALPVASNEPGILGKIGHLALVQQDDIARVLSWHMAADMDCVITHTTAKAKDVYHQTGGRQQVLPLDSIYRKNLPEWSKPLLMERYRPGFKAGGNPVYARNLLEFPKEEESCKTVFGMLLGDTLILDTLDHANIYRQELVKFTHCPTILTRTGDRIRSNGKFGGAMNKAPPLDKLKGCVFGQPLPLTYHAVCTQIETLERFNSALSSSAAAQGELQEQLELQKLPETAAKMKEFKDTEQRLREVEAKLGMNLPGQSRSTPNQRSNRSNSSTTVSSGSEPALKKPKLEPGIAPSPSKVISPRRQPRKQILPQSSTPVVAETSASATPARVSRRIASMTPVISEDGRKRLKKTA